MPDVSMNTQSANPAVTLLSCPEVHVREKHKTDIWKNPRILGRIAEIDGLRGIAILIVVFFHYVTGLNSPQHPLWRFVTTSTSLFWSGVDLFFVLSGFLI